VGYGRGGRGLPEYHLYFCHSVFLENGESSSLHLFIASMPIQTVTATAASTEEGIDRDCLLKALKGIAAIRNEIVSHNKNLGGME